MGIVNSTTLYADALDFTKARAEEVYFAFIIRLPFRFRVKSPYHSHFENHGTAYDIWIRNKPMEVTDPGMGLHSLIRRGGNVEDLWSTVAIIPNEGKITADELSAVQNCQGNVDKVAIESRKKQLFPAMQALNAFIIGYHTATGEMWGGQPLQAMTIHEYMNSITWEISLIGIPLADWSEETINELFDLKATREFQVGASITGEMFDLPPEKLAGIGQAIDRLNSFYFYELAFEAKAKMVSSDYIGALLLAVAALEGVHAAFVMHVLEARLPTGRTGDDKNLEEDFVKELGFSLCNKLTPYLFMDAAERPPQDLIQKVAKAVNYRNEVMHALRSSSGAYRIRTRTNADLTDASSAVLQLYDLYRKAFEKAVSFGTVALDYTVPFTSTDFHDLLDPDLWVIEQMLTLPSDPEPTITRKDGAVHIAITDTIAMPQMQGAVADYRRRILPVIFIVSQKVYAELFRLVLGHCGTSVRGRQVDVEHALAALVSAGGVTSFHPFSDEAAFQAWWSGTYDYKRLRLARNRVAHHSYVFKGGRLSVTDGTGGVLLDWTETEILSFAGEVLRLSRNV